MADILDILIIVAIAAVAIVLAFGLINMLRRGPANLSQRLMRWRVGLQFVALCLMMATLYFYTR